MRPLAITVATAALVALPMFAAAQSPDRDRPQEHNRQYSDRSADSMEHLQQARRAIDSIDLSSLRGRDKSEVKKIKDEFDHLYSRYEKQARRGEVGTSGRFEKKENEERSDFRKIDRQLDRLNIQGNEQGVPPGRIARENRLPSDVYGRLVDFRTHLDRFERMNGGGSDRR